MAISMNFAIIYNELKRELIRRKILKDDEKLSMQEMVYLCGKDFYYQVASKFSEKELSWSEFDEEAIKQSLSSKGFKV